MAEAHPAGHLGNIGDQPEVSSFGMSLLPGNVCVLDPLEAGACVPGCLGPNVRMKFCSNVPTVVAPCMVNVLAGRTPSGDAWEEGNPQNWMLRPSEDYISESLRRGLYYDTLNTGGPASLLRNMGPAEVKQSFGIESDAMGGHFCFQMPPPSEQQPEPRTVARRKTRIRRAVVSDSGSS